MRNACNRVLTALILIVIPGTIAMPHSQQRSVAATQGQPVAIHNGFLTGQDFRNLTEAGKRSYAAGLVDGMLLAPFVGAPKARLEWLETCVTGMSDEQVAAIISKFVRDNPARWHEPLHVQFYAAVKQACPQAP